MSSSTLTIEAPTPDATGTPGAPAPWPGARQARWTLTRMLGDPARDLRATTHGPASAIVLGPGADELAADLLRLGYDTATATDPAKLNGIGAGRAVTLVVLLGGEDLSMDEAGTLAWARQRTLGACAFPTADRHTSRERALAAGFAHVSMIEPAADAERSWVMHERVLLLARPGDDETAVAAAARSGEGGPDVS